MCARLEKVGVALKADRRPGVAGLRRWRVNYDRVLVELAGLVMAPDAPWSSDRATDSRRPPLFAHIPGKR